jgi:hypothetical protein
VVVSVAAPGAAGPETATEQLAARLYALLPAVYRIRDEGAGGPLQALLAVIAAQAAVVQENIDQLYDDEFIETCAAWVVPYIGDLVGSDEIYDLTAAASGRRAEVANTIGYRRRKGTLLALEQVAMDVSGLPAAAVEFFHRVITTESMRHVRPRHAATADLRRGLALERLESAFDTLNRTVEVRRIAPRVLPQADPDPSALASHLHGGGRYNVPDVGVYLWRWKSLPVTDAPAVRVDPRRYLVSPLGQDMPLFNHVAPRDSFSRLTGRLDVPQPILRREFAAAPGAFYGPGASVQVYADGTPVPLSQICCRDLSDGPAGTWGCTAPGRVAVDPLLGRIQFADDLPAPRQVRIDYSYGFPAEIAGGPYDRSSSLTIPDPPERTFTAVVGTPATPSLEDAVAAWNTLAPGAAGLIVLPDFESYAVDLTGSAAIALPSGSRLWIAAARVHAAGAPPSYDGACVTLRGDIAVRGVLPPGAAPGTPPQAGQLVLSGVWTSGAVAVTGAAVDLQFLDCTLVPGIALERDGRQQLPGEPSLAVDSAGATVALIRCVSGPVGVAPGGTARICSSIIDSSSACGVAYAGPDLAGEGADLYIEDCTVIGKVHVHTMTLASNTIFLSRRARRDPWPAALWCSRRQDGCMRFCVVPADAITPRRFRCLPDSPDGEDALRPHFVTLRYGHPSYGLLGGDTPWAVWTGADDGGQIGAYHPLGETQAVRNVQIRAQEYLPFGLETGILLEPSRPVILSPVRFAYGYGRPVRDLCGGEEEELWFTGIGANLI